MKKSGKKSSNRKPRRTPTASPDTLTLDLLGHAYAIQSVTAEPTPGRKPDFGATTWTYLVSGLRGATARVIILFMDLLEFEVASDVFPVTCTGVPDGDVKTVLRASTPRRLQVNRAMVTFSDGAGLGLQGSLEISSRAPTTAERTRFNAATPGNDQLSNQPDHGRAQLTDNTPDNVQKITFLADGASITRPGCRAVLEAMATLGAISADTARTENEILKQSSSRAKSINGLFATHSGVQQRYADFRKKHVKNTGHRCRRYYLVLFPTPEKDPKSMHPSGAKTERKALD
ncbi:MAG: hypothetical protein WCL16_06215 [bacterium]